uniref:Actin n=1 Tax=Romanomermis culicivorax TaxID=13658 RepID=A0A915J5I8_ROMCU
MSGGVYGGDEVGALVFDPGHYSLRAGFAGEELPKVSKMPHAYFNIAQNIRHFCFSRPKSRAPSAISSRIRQFRCRRTKIGQRAALKTSLIKIEDFEMFDNVLEYAFKYFNAESNLHPVLMSEDPLNTKAKRERTAEILFEKYNVPAFYLCKTAVLATFANNRPSGLVVDSGATHTTAVPVYDGYVLTKGIVKTPLGGDAMTNQCKVFLDEANIDVVPSYMIGSKEPVAENAPARWTKKSNLAQVTKSYHNQMCKEVIQDFQASVLQVNDTPYDSEIINIG